MDLALVGFTNSYNDKRWLEMAAAWVAEHDPALPGASATRKVFDLRGANGVNFLDDAGEYGVVVLFAIYNPPKHSAETRYGTPRTTCVTSAAIVPKTLTITTASQ